MGTVHLLLGGNCGNRRQFLETAVELIKEQIGQITGRSSLYETEPWGFHASTLFLNQVIRVETAFSPIETLHCLQRIEQQLGRRKKSDHYESRVIDIDILMFDDLQMLEQDLQIPHPRLHLRKFTLVPLAEIAGGLKHPVLKVDMDTLNRECRDDLKVALFAGDR